ncbi:MAG: PfkB family carbohydrate kinase [Bacteroidota bacterium]
MAEKRAFSDCHILVLGDLMVDRYLWGKVTRISPEAPVPIVDVHTEENRLGGAANVALNLKALGATVDVLGVVGEDEMGRILVQMADQAGFGTEGIVAAAAIRTTLKVRILGHHQQVLRVDKEDRVAPNEETENELLRVLGEKISHSHALIIEDYDKNALAPGLIQRVIALAREKDVPVMVDPKFKHFFAYEGVTLFKPNLKELNEGLGLRLEGRDQQRLVEALETLRARMPHQFSLITLSEYGMLLVDDEGNHHTVEAHRREIADVSGAGDTVISVAALALAAGWLPLEAVQLANLAGGLVCESVGVVPINADRLQTEAIRLGLWAN